MGGEEGSGEGVGVASREQPESQLIGVVVEVEIQGFRRMDGGIPVEVRRTVCHMIKLVYEGAT